MTDDRLDVDIRTLLARLDPGSAPSALRDAVRAIPSTDARLARIRLILARARPMLAGFATLAVLVSAVALVALVRSSAGSGGPSPSTAAIPVTPGFDPTADGAGIASPPNDVLLPTVIVLAGVVVFALLVRRPPFRIRVLATVLTLATVGGAFYLRSTPLVAWREGATGPGIGWVGDVAGDAGPVAGGRMFAIGPNGVLTYGFDVTNTGPLPIDLVGLTADVDGGSWVLGRGPSSSSVAGGSLRVTAAGLLRDETSIDLDPPNTRPFERIGVDPGGRRFVILAARAPRCALGRDNRADSEQSNDSLDRVGVVYDVLGFRAMAVVQLPEPLFVPLQLNCDPAG